jgi:hypothetical protein
MCMPWSPAAGAHRHWRVTTEPPGALPFCQSALTFFRKVTLGRISIILSALAGRDGKRRICSCSAEAYRSDHRVLCPNLLAKCQNRQRSFVLYGWPTNGTIASASFVLDHVKARM